MRPLFALVVLLVIGLGLISCKRETAVAIATAPASTAPVPKPVQIPGIAPPGSSDWTQQAHRVSVLTPVDHGEGTKANLAVAWTPFALLLQIHTDDATPSEGAHDPWNNDSVEVFLASAPGSDDLVQFICVPGRSPEHPKPSWTVNDKRKEGPHIVAPDLHTDKEGDGYAMTISIPWANLRHIPQPGEVIGLQVYVNDAQAGGQVSHRIWFPVHGASNHPDLMQQVKLTGQADVPEETAAWLQPKGFDEVLQVSAGAESAGKKIAVWLSGKQIASGELKAGGPDGSTATLPLSSELAAQKDAPLIVTLDGTALPSVIKMPDLAKRRLELLKRLSIVAIPSIFDTAGFPKVDFLNKELVEAAIGTYALHVRFFDAGWNEVTTPKEPGRYGALVEFRSEDGKTTFTRNLTLFKTPQPYAPMKDPYGVTVKFPTAFGLSGDVLTKEQWNINNWAGRTLQDLAHNDPDWAVLVAGLHDLAANPARWHGFTAWTIDDLWWAELHKRLGEDQEYAHLTYLPDGYDQDKKKTWPLILFLHGSGERGADLDMVKDQGPQGYVSKGHPLPFIVVTPQCPLDEWWDPARLAHLIDEVSAKYRVDPKRIYVTGLSMGGYGSFDLAASYPDKIAAIAPLSGGASPDIADRLKKMPTWIFHGSEDTVVPARYSTDVAHAMQKGGNPAKLTIYPGVAHGGWNVTYADPALYAWFLEHSK